MSKIIHPKWTFPNSKVHIPFGSSNTFPTLESSTQKIATFSLILQEELSKLGISDTQSELAMRNTGGHMDIDYYSLVLIDQTGGLECIFYQKSWNDEFESISPSVQLFGSWVQLERNMKAFLSDAL